MQVLPPAARLLRRRGVWRGEEWAEPDSSVWFGLVWFGSANNCRLVSIQQRCGAARPLAAGASDSTLSTSEAKISPQNLGEPWWKS
jgi:hypothetical protein